jgi:hypothetical protein
MTGSRNVQRLDPTTLCLSFPSPMGRGRREAPGKGCCPIDSLEPLTPTLSPWERERSVVSRASSIILAPIFAGAAFLALASGAALADDYDYRDRRDTISSSAGNANAANIATQTIDPWPPYAKNTNSHLDGQRARVGITRYQENKSVPPRGLGTTTISGQAGPGAQSSTSLQK